MDLARDLLGRNRTDYDPPGFYTRAPATRGE